MKILVLVKVVAVLDDEFELLGEGRGVDPDFLEWDVNEWDAFSLEAALQLREASGAGEVVVATVGGDEVEDGLLSCLAKGADRAIRVWDQDLAGADVLTVARTLAAVVERESADLVLCGAQSSDAVTGSTGAALAGYLDMPRVAVVSQLEWSADGRTATVRRELEGGMVEVLSVSTPAVLTIQTGINEPRYATLRAIKQARDKPLDVAGLGDLGLSADAVEAAAGSRTVALATPERGATAEMLDGDPAAVAAQIVEIVKERISG
jgi:electron transfer flavoprotein beta subunit